jgi:hypothetical protein
VVARVRGAAHRVHARDKVDHDNPKHRLDGNALKFTVSGGDSAMVRRNYSDEMHTQFDGRLFMMCNEFPPVRPRDALEFVHIIMTRFKFVPKEIFEDDGQRLPLHRLGDPTIKAWARRPEVIDAITRIVLDGYRRDGGAVVPCAIVKRDTRYTRRTTAPTNSWRWSRRFRRLAMTTTRSRASRRPMRSTRRGSTSPSRNFANASRRLAASRPPTSSAPEIWRARSAPEGCNENRNSFISLISFLARAGARVEGAPRERSDRTALEDR